MIEQFWLSLERFRLFAGLLCQAFQKFSLFAPFEMPMERSC
jgi:hypothetical protein